MEAYIYTYVNKLTKKTYIGSRSAYKGSCYDDFNIKYFSSSKDTEFLEDMKNGLLEGQIVLVINRPDAKTKIVELEHMMIAAYWEQYGKENSYNKYCNGKFNFAGKHFSEESKKKLSDSHKGKPGALIGKNHSTETKQKMSENHSHYWKGKSGPRKGKHLSEESRNKISESLKGKHLSEETKKKISEAQKGKTIQRTKAKWLTPDGSIIEMAIISVKRYHKDWIQIN